MEFSQSTVECDAWLDGYDYIGHGSVHVTLIGTDVSQSEQIEMTRLYTFPAHLHIIIFIFIILYGNDKISAACV